LSPELAAEIQRLAQSLAEQILRIDALERENAELRTELTELRSAVRPRRPPRF
jgi:chaperonin cofactor prefoldin